MGRVSQTVDKINTTIRTLLASVALFFVGGTGYVVYDKVTKDERELRVAQGQLVKVQEELEDAQQQVTLAREELAVANQEIERLGISMRLLKTDMRLGRLDVVNQTTDQEGQLFTSIRFVEVAEDGTEIGPEREFTLKGDLVYVDNWVVKFDDEFVEQAHLQKGTSLVLFRRIFGEEQKPIDGYQLDEVGLMPQAYASGGQPSDFEKEIWDQFWLIANDRERAKGLGIRAAHGEAVSIKVQPNRSYKIVLRASDGLSIVPVQ